MESRIDRKTRLAIVTLALLLLAASPVGFPTVKADSSTTSGDPVTITNHVNLGFTASMPFSANPHACDPVVGAFCYNVMFTGTANIFARISADISLTYNPAELVAGGTLPVTITYTPTSGGSLASVDIPGTLIIDFTGCLSGCGNSNPHPYDVASGSAAFSAPMGSDSPVTIPGSSGTVTIDPLGSLDISSSLTLAPAPPGSLTGLGGAAGIVSVASGGTLASPALGLLEWDTSGSSQSATVQLPASSVAGGVDIQLQPVLHWLGTSGSANLNIHFSDFLKGLYAFIVGAAVGGLGCLVVDCTLHDPAPVSLFSGGLGPVYSSIHLDTMIGNAVGGLAGPLVTNRVAAGFVPVPLLAPPLSAIPPIPSTLGSIHLSIPGVGITGAPSDAVLAGSTISLSASVHGGSGPFSYSWTRDGVPFGTSQSITDTAVAGSTIYAVTVTDSKGAVSNTDRATINGYDFSISLAPSSFTVPFGAPATYTVSVFLTGGAGLAGVPSSVSISLLGVPPGGSTAGLPSSLPLGTSVSSATFNVTTSQTTPVGDYTLTIKGSTDTGFRTGTAVLHVITPQQAAQNLLSLIGSMGLPNGTTSSLEGRLGQVMDLITSGNNGAACNKLDSFISLVNTDVANGKLTPAQASQLINQANLISLSLGC